MKASLHMVPQHRLRHDASGVSYLSDASLGDLNGRILQAVGE